MSSSSIPTAVDSTPEASNDMHLRRQLKKIKELYEESKSHQDALRSLLADFSQSQSIPGYDIEGVHSFRMTSTEGDDTAEVIQRGLKDLQEENQQLRAKYLELHRISEEQQARIDELQTQCEEQQNALDDKTELERTLGQQAADAFDPQETLRAAIEAESVKRLEAEVERLKAEKEQMGQRVKTAHESEQETRIFIFGLRKDYDNKLAELQKMKVKSDAKIRSAENTAGRKVEMQKQVDEAQTKLAEQRTEMATSEKSNLQQRFNELQASQSTPAYVQSELDIVDDRLSSETKSSIKELQDKLDEAQTKLQEAVDTVRTKNETIEAALQSSVTVLQERKKHETELLDKIAELEAETAGLKVEADRVPGLADEAEASKKELSKVLQSLIQHKELLNKAYNDIEELDAEIDALIVQRDKYYAALVKE